MKNFSIFMTLVAVLFVSGCVKPVQNTQPVYTQPTQPVYPNSTQTTYPDATQPIVYEPAGTTVPAGTTYGEYNPNNSTTTLGPPITYPDYSTGGVTTTGAATTYPDPYATGGGVTATTTYPDPYASQPSMSSYPATSYPSSPATSYPEISYPSSSSSAQGGGIHLQIAALKDYYTAENYKKGLSLEPGLSAYVVRGAMNKVIVSGIPSVAEANRLKERRFPGAFIVKGAASSPSTGYTPPVDPYSTPSSGGGVYTIDNPYGSASSSTLRSGIGVQVGAFGSQGKAQSVANAQSGQYPAVVKKIGRYWKVILTGFSSRSAAKAHASRIGGFVVDSY